MRRALSRYGLFRVARTGPDPDSPKWPSALRVPVALLWLARRPLPASWAWVSWTWEHLP